ncbi:ABC transporter substrate-binding protein [Asticcacaulis sp. BYS171W]|uniref:ABC transporter substrate-binding protein n=1 Tax=Asticcacaulis aquaticus TaxID=2984212 RepID=A0ABT5HWY2_9CAUL|nr:ABC transporter substrate-binding protein [Asticcacaulis aquaticus]MDC7684585.1 ABC transporter substrate-binding protein [Asticcacaulis aquaticus]
MTVRPGTDTSTATMPSQLVWYARCPTLTAMGLLANRGALQREFLREPINLVSVRENSTPSVRQGYLDHSLPNLIREGDAATALWSYGLNQRSRLLAVGHTWHTVLVVASGRSGIGRLNDLKGRTLALPREAGAFSPARVRSLRAWETILDTVGLRASDIEFHNIVADHPSTPFGDIARREIEAVLSGQADAGLLFGAKGLELARAAGLKVIHSFTPEVIRNDPALSGLVELRTLTVDYPFLEANEAVVARLLRQLTSAADWAAQFPKEALNHIALEGKVEVADAAQAYGPLINAGAALGAEDWRLRDLQVLLDWLKLRHAVDDSLNLTPWQRTDVLNIFAQPTDIKEKYKRLNVVA